ncbi:MAG: D-alanyl-D-alanine carboxypeptidase [Thermoplasmataceae archaeon]
MPGIVAYTFLDKDGNVISSKNSEILLTPASNLKIVSAYISYKILSRDFLFKTFFKVKDGILYVYGDPTPLLDGQKLEEIGEDLVYDSTNINKIILDTSVLDSKFYGKGWSMDNNNFPYQTKISPFSVNEGCVPLNKGPFDLHDLNDVHNRLTIPVKNQSGFFARCLWKSIKGNYKVSYGLDTKNSEIEEQGGIAFTQSIKDLIKHIETYSCNFSAEILTKYLSHFVYNRMGNWKDSTSFILEYLGKMGFDESELAIVDGSGLSRLNLLSTNFLASFIYKIQQNGDNEFIDLLPKPGLGTLSNRLKELSEFGINAKTGSLSYCSSLTGFSRKHGISFSIIVNNSKDKPEDLTAEVDGILRKNLTSF